MKSRFNLAAPRHDHGPSPKHAFEMELADFEARRGHELEPGYDGHTVDYRYYLPAFLERLNGAISADKIAEGIRADLRSGKRRPGDAEVQAWNTHPAAVLRVIATIAGLRVIPLARWVAQRINDQSFAFEVEAEYRKWVDQADAVWSLLVELPGTQANHGSFEANMRPLLSKMRKLTAQVDRWIEDYDRSGMLTTG